MLPEVRLDTDTFRALIEEYRMQITGILPEWTNYNFSDPGMTFVELFAWMKENQQFFMEQLSDLHYQQFYRLLGFSRKPLKPEVIVARGSVVARDKTEEIRKGTVFYSDDVPYTVTGDGVLTGIIIVGVQTGVLVDRSQLESTGDLCIYPFGTDPQIGASCTVLLSGALEPSQMYTALLTMEDRGLRNDGFISECHYLSRIEMEYYTASGWKKGPLVMTHPVDSANTVMLYFYVEEPMDVFESGDYAIRFTYKDGKFDIVPVVKKLVFGGILLEQKVRKTFGKEGKELGEGTGFPSQRIETGIEDMIPEGTVIQVRNILDSSVWDTWEYVENFSGAAPESMVYTVEDGTLVFGDGERGLPPEGPIRLMECVISRGSRNNIHVGAELKSEDGTRLHAMGVVSEGRDAETMDQLKARVKAGSERIVASTAEDYEKLIAQIPGLIIKECKVDTERSTANDIYIAVRPGDGRLDLTLSSELEKGIRGYLEDRRLAGICIHLISVRYIYVDVKVSFTPSNAYGGSKKPIEDCIEEYFSTAPRIGSELEYGDIFGKLNGLKGIRSLNKLELNTDDISVTRDNSGNLIPPSNGLFRLGKITMTSE